MSEIQIPDDISTLVPFLNNLDRESLKSFKHKNLTNKPIAIPALDTVLTKNIKALDETSILHLCQLGLHSLFDNFEFVVICVRDLIRRKDVDAQNAFVDIVIVARDEYDPGHRCYEKTVLDQLIDTLLGQFSATALIRLLHGLDYSVLSTDGSDGFAELFPVAFAKLRDEPAETLLQAIQQYVQDCRNYGDDLPAAVDMLQRILKQNHPEAITQTLQTLLQQLEEDNQLADLFATEDLSIASQLLERTGRDIPLLHAVRYHITSTLLYNHAKTLPFDALCEMYRRCFANQRAARSPETDLGRLLFPLFCNKPDAAKQFALNFADECNEREFFIKCVEWAIRDGDYDEKEALQTAKDSLALLKGLDPVAERAREELKDRRSSLESAISWALSNGDYAEADHLFADPANQSIIDAKTFGNILMYTGTDLEQLIMDKDYESARHFVSFNLDLVDFKKQHPDPLPVIEGREPTFEERFKMNKADILNGFPVESFTSLAVVLACYLGAGHEALTSRIIALAKEVVAIRADDRSYSGVAYNLACYYALHGNKPALLEYLAIALRQYSTKEKCLAEEDFKAYWEDVDFLAVLDSVQA